MQRNDIKSQPVWPIIIFGDGKMGRMTDCRANQDSRGVITKIMKIMPTQDLVKEYDIPKDMIDENRLIRVELPESSIQQISNNPASPVFITYLNIFGQETIMSRMFKGYQDVLKIQAYEQRISLLTAENAYLTERVQKLTTQEMKFIKDDIVGVADLLRVEVNTTGTAQNPQAVGPVREL